MINLSIENLRLEKINFSLLLSLVFFPGALGIIVNLVTQEFWADKLLAFSLFLFCLEQCKMAILDLRQIREVKRYIKEPRLDNFTRITIITIIVEVIGFYVCSFSLYWGGIIIMTSLILFNLLADIQLETIDKTTLKNLGIIQKLPLLIADILGLILVTLAMLGIASLAINSVLLIMVITYGCLKYVRFNNSIN
ncbi:MAG TPA: hypothetical protein DCF68_22055 [Cyanothece sp. UBA12306]|nr:hypothetical protein [Cyanothece sp. UBA12306]